MNTLPQNYDDSFSVLVGGKEITVDDSSASETLIFDAATGPVSLSGPDFTKPLRTVVGRNPVQVLTVNSGNPDFPVVAMVQVDGVLTPVLYSLMGEDQELAHNIENVPPLPSVAIGRVLRSKQDDSLIFDNRVFGDEKEARDFPAEGFEFISTYRVVLPQINERGEQEEIEESDDTGPQYMVVNGRTLNVGDEITVSRRGYGYRQAEIVKFRQAPTHKVCFVQPRDGSSPYWALNRSIR